MDDRNRIITFFVSQIILQTTLLVFIVLSDAWLSGAQIFLNDVLSLIVAAIITVGVFLLVVETPIQFVLKAHKILPSVMIGVAVGAGFSSLIDFGVSLQEGMILCRRPVLYFAFIMIGGIYAVRLRRIIHLSMSART